MVLFYFIVLAILLACESEPSTRDQTSAPCSGSTDYQGSLRYVLLSVLANNDYISSNRKLRLKLYEQKLKGSKTISLQEKLDVGPWQLFSPLYRALLSIPFQVNLSFMDLLRWHLEALGYKV